MKLSRFTLVAAVLALGAAACGDDVQVVEPTPPQPPPPPPVEATMAPASASVAVGNSVVFAVNASGGVAGEAASWTCSSSNTGIATVTSTSAGCSATGVAAGDVTITASVTKSGETVNVGAQLTVTSDEVVEPPQPPGDPAFVVVASITGEGDTDVSGLRGRVSVTLNVERGDQELEELALLVDGEVVASQSFGSGMDMGMTPPDEAAEQAVHAFTMSFDSDGYEEHGDHTDVDYANGEHTIAAELEIGVTMADGMHGHETISSNVVTVEFDNKDFIAASFSGLGDGAMNEETGQVWYGGPGASVEVNALPVLFSGSDVSSLTLLSFCGEDAATDSEAPFSFSVDCDETSDKDGDGEKPEFSIGGNEIDVKAKAVYLDFDGPPAPHFNADPNGREGGWINEAVLVATSAGEFHRTRNKDGWLVYNDDGEGVGGYQAVLRFSSTTPTIVDGARGGAPNALPTAPTKANAACVIATAVDLLGNESGLPRAGSDCVTAANYVGEEDDDGNMTYPAGLRAGLDVAAPTIAFSPASPKANASSLKEFQVQVADAGASSTGRSGLHSTPVLSMVEARDADNDVLCGDDKDLGVDGGGEESVSGVCELAGGIGFNDPLATTDGLSDADVAGYYTFTAVAQDKAGNKSEAAVRLAVNDDEAPELGLIVGGYSKGAWSLTATLTDDLSLKAYWAEAFDNLDIDGQGASDVLILPREGSVAVDEYNSADLTQSLLTTPPVTMQTYRAMQAAGPGDAPAAIDSIRVVGTDHGGGSGSASALQAALGATTSLDRFGLQAAATGLAAGDGTGEFEDEALTYARDEVFQTFTVEDDKSDADVLELRATITGTTGYTEAVAEVVADPTADPPIEAVAAVPGVEGLVNNPVSRVDFYASVALKNVGTTDVNRVPPAPGGVGDEALLFLGSASAAGAEDFDATPDAEGGESRRYIWGIDMSGADFLEAVDGDAGNYRVFAIAVNSDGVAISAVSADIAVDD